MRDMSAAHWRKSRRSGAEGGDCVEIADLTSAVAVRDSKNPDGPTLTFDAAEWHAFTHRIKTSGHDLT